MKKYCLKPKAKTQIVEGLISISIAIAFILFLAGIIGLPLSFIVAPDSIAEFIACYIGIISWTVIFSFIAIGIKRWLQSNIIEC